MKTNILSKLFYNLLYQTQWSRLKKKKKSEVKTCIFPSKAYKIKNKGLDNNSK